MCYCAWLRRLAIAPILFKSIAVVHLVCLVLNSLPQYYETNPIPILAGRLVHNIASDTGSKIAEFGKKFQDMEKEFGNDISEGTYANTVFILNEIRDQGQCHPTSIVMLFVRVFQLADMMFRYRTCRREIAPGKHVADRIDR